MICKSLTPIHRPWRRRGYTLAAAGLALFLTGCEWNSFFDQSKVGRWDRTPVTLPILEQLDVIDEPPTGPQNVTTVTREDHIPDNREYILGRGDMITVSVFELLHPGQESVHTRRIDEVGTIRLPIIGAVRASGMSPSQLEAHIREQLARMGVLRDAQVSVVIQQALHNTFSVMGEPSRGGTAVGTYQIQRPDFRLMEALAMARGIPDRTQRIHIYRQVHLHDGDVESPVRPQPQQQPQQPGDPTDLIEQLLQGENAINGPTPTPTAAGQNMAAESRHHRTGTPGGHWMHVDGQWVSTASPDGVEGMDDLTHHRIIEIPYQQLMTGDPRYNIIIRPGDVIRVPAPMAGFVYLMGEINRPGAFTVPGENEITVKQIVASGGNLSPIAVPERVDLIRRIGSNQEAIVRINVREIFRGNEPDFFLKPNDTLNFGTTFWATPLAIVRNGFRATYGFGFIVDRNFAPDIFD